MDNLTVYPFPVGATVQDANGDPISADGIAVPQDDPAIGYYRDLVRSGSARTQDPRPGGGGPPIPVPTYREAADVRLFGAKGDGVTDDTGAIQRALDAAESVYLPTLPFRTTGTLVMREGQTFRGDGKSSILKVDHDGFAIRIRNVSFAEVRDMRIDCSTRQGASGVYILAEEGAVFSPKLRNLRIDLAVGNAECFGVDLYITNPVSGACIYNPLIQDCDILGFGSNLAAQGTGIRARGPALSGSRSTGGRVIGGRIAWMKMGVDVDNIDTFEILTTTFDSIIETAAGVSTANAGRAIKFGASTFFCAARGVRVEDCDVAYETVYDNVNHVAAQECLFDSAQGFSPAQILDVAGSQKTQAESANLRAPTFFGRRAMFGSSIEAHFYEDAVLSNGANQNVADQSGVISPFIRVTGPTSAFSIGSIKGWIDAYVPNAPAKQSGSIKYVYNTTGQTCTVKHQDPAASIPEQRIITMTGADVAVPGPAVMRFIYDETSGGHGTKRWIYMGAG